MTEPGRPHETVIREKYRLNDWFSRKVDAYRATPRENENEKSYKFTSKKWLSRNSRLNREFPYKNTQCVDNYKTIR